MTSGKILKLQRIAVLSILISGLAWLMTGCGIYSFTGASVPPEAKTVSVTLFPNKADLVQPTLSQTFTDALRDKFASQTSLAIVPRGGDLHFEGEITGYATEPVAITGQQTAALIRLKITVNVRYTSKFSPKDDFESTFTRYEDYNSSLNLSAVEADLITKISEALVEDIFNKAVVNW
ncbi:MAG: LPS assembly lipoprotein LptE [Lentimicrobium sp.]|nr:LPS assembly lipoprotein LptE [Lentimicrobium sp.]